MAIRIDLTGTPLALRPARAADVDAIRALHFEAVRPVVETTWGWDESDQAARFEAAFDPARIEVVLVDGAFAGRLELEEREDDVFLRVIEIARAYRGRGLGTALLRALLAATDALGRSVELQVLRANRARTLYERLGFERVGESEHHVQMRRAPR